MQEFVFIGSESSKNTFYGISLDTIFTTFITIFIFILGYLINRHFVNKKESKNLKDIKLFFILYIKSIIEPFEHYIDATKKLSKDLEDLNNRKLGFSESAKLTVDENIIDQIDLFRAFVFKEKSDKDKKIVHLKNILNVLILIRKVKENVKETFFKFNDDLRRYENQLRESMNAVLRSYDFFLSKGLQSIGMGNLDNDLFLKGLKDIISNWNKIDKHEHLDITFENLIKPLKEYCRRNINDPRALQLVPMIISYIDAFDNIKALRNIYSGIFSDVASDLDSELSNINDALKVLK